MVKIRAFVDRVMFRDIQPVAEQNDHDLSLLAQGVGKRLMGELAGASLWFTTGYWLTFEQIATLHNPATGLGISCAGVVLGAVSLAHTGIQRAEIRNEFDSRCQLLFEQEGIAPPQEQISRQPAIYILTESHQQDSALS